MEDLQKIAEALDIRVAYLMEKEPELPHLSDELIDFVKDPANVLFIEEAYLKARQMKIQKEMAKGQA
jgi:hypothetical protein